MIWMRHKKSGWFLTTAGPMKSLALNGSRIKGYASIESAKTALATIALIRELCWDDFEPVSLGLNEEGEVVTL